MDQSHGGLGILLLPLLLLAVAVISVPLARLLRLSAIVAYLAAGVETPATRIARACVAPSRVGCPRK